MMQYWKGYPELALRLMVSYFLPLQAQNPGFGTKVFADREGVERMLRA